MFRPKPSPVSSFLFIDSNTLNSDRKVYLYRGLSLSVTEFLPAVERAINILTNSGRFLTTANTEM